MLSAAFVIEALRVKKILFCFLLPVVKKPHSLHPYLHACAVTQYYYDSILNGIIHAHDLEVKV